METRRAIVIPAQPEDVFKEDLSIGKIVTLNALNGLCRSCLHRGTCVLSTKRGVTSCEEFAAEPPEKNGMQKRGREIFLQEESPELYQGLCVNCDKREHCCLRATEGGVWHCEEYC